MIPFLKLKYIICYKMYFFSIGPSEKDNKKVKVVIFDEKKKRKKTLHIG